MKKWSRFIVLFLAVVLLIATFAACREYIGVVAAIEGALMIVAAITLMNVAAARSPPVSSRGQDRKESSLRERGYLDNHCTTHMYAFTACLSRSWG